MTFKKFKRYALRFIAKFIFNKAVTLICRTLRIEVRNQEHLGQLKKQNQKFILAFWHGTMLLPWFLHRNEGMASLISGSKDGNLLAALLKEWNYEVIRGSSSSGGDAALNGMVSCAKNDRSIAITPDGPRGPAIKMKAGAVITAKKSGLPLILAGTFYKKKVELKTWDRFQIPTFFSKVVLVYSKPIYIDPDLDYQGTSVMIGFCESELKKIQQEAANVAASSPDRRASFKRVEARSPLDNLNRCLKKRF
jgi:lysophospholipid acyltransferase (LPLAT)-like uncharacterized protein